MSRINEAQFRQVLKSVTGNPISLDPDVEIDQVFSALINAGSLRLPCAASEMFVVYDRLPIFSDIIRKRSSLLLQQLFDRYAETGVVVDALLAGRNALFLTKLINNVEEIQGWLSFMEFTTMELTVRPVDEEYKLVIAPLKSFVPRHEAAC